MHTAPTPERVYYVQADGVGMPRRDSSGNVIRRNPDLLDPTVHEQVVEEWRTKDVLHREDGPARTWADGAQEWWVNGRRHRLLEEGPAVEYPPGYAGWESGPHERWVDGQLHRTAGPALQSFVDVGGYRVIPGHYFLNGVRMTNVRRDWSILRHHTPEGPRRTLHVHNVEAWDALLSIGAVDTGSYSISPTALDTVLALNLN